MRNYRRGGALPYVVVALLMAAFALAVTGCGDDDKSSSGGGGGGGGDSADTGSGPPQGKQAKIAAFGITSPETSRWDEQGKLAMEKAAGVLGAKPTWLSNIAFDQAGQTLDRLVREDHNVMISNGAGFADGVLDAAAKYPDKWFWVYSALADTKGLPNVVGIDLHWNEIGYLAGAIACTASESKKIGVVLAQPIPAYTHGLGGVTDGVKAACGSEKNLLVTWSGTFDDNGKSKQATNALIGKGADVIIDFQDAATPGVQSAIKEHPDVKYVGTMFDWANDIPDQIITSIAIDYEDGYVDTAKLLLDKKLEPKVYASGVATGGLELTAFANSDASVEEKGKKLFDDIKSGAVKVDLTHAVGE
ncbi:MAG TPA: BMP family ABC transporter substrate-binding protein [Thermoleophilaceae bacterium]|nr:BMP family ABC transporter substrate-binding protein [Thermoleophilaceae bacterium]